MYTYKIGCSTWDDYESVFLQHKDNYTREELHEIVMKAFEYARSKDKHKNMKVHNYFGELDFFVYMNSKGFKVVYGDVYVEIWGENNYNEHVKNNGACNS